MEEPTKADITAKKYQTLVNRFCVSQIREARKRINSNLILTYIESALTVISASNLETIPETQKNVELIIDSYKEFRTKSKQDFENEVARETARLNADVVVAKNELETLNSTLQQITNSNGSAEDIKAIEKEIKDKKSKIISLYKNIIKNKKYVKEKFESFDVAEKILSKTLSFIKSESGIQGTNANGSDIRIQDVIDRDKKEKKKEKLKNAAGIGITALTGSPLLAMIPSGIRSFKSGLKDFKENTKAGKAATIAKLGFGALSILGTGSPGALMLSSHFGQKANASLQKKRDSEKAIKDINTSILRKRIRDSRSSLDAEGRAISGTRGIHSEFTLPSTPNKEVSPTAESKSGIQSDSFSKSQIDTLINVLYPNDPQRAADARRSFGFSAKNGGIFDVIGGSSSGDGGSIDNLKVHKGETVKVTPKGKDPVVKELEETNKLLQDLVTSNKDIAEDAAEARAREGLARKKDPKAEKTEGSGLLGLLKKDKDPKAPGLLDKAGGRLKEMAISKFSAFAGKFGKLGKMVGGAASMMSDATPVYVVNAADIGGGGLGDFLKKTPTPRSPGSVIKGASKVPTTLATNASAMSNVKSLADIRKMPAGAERTAALESFKATKAASTIAEGGTSVASKSGGIFSKGLNAVKGVGAKVGSVASKIPGAGLISKIGPRGIPIIGGALAGGLSYASTRAEGGSKTKAIGGAGGAVAGGALGGIIGSLGGPIGTVAGTLVGSLAGEYLGKKLGGLFDKQNETEKKLTDEKKEIEAIKSDENKTFIEKMSSIWGDGSKSLLQKVGGSISSAYQSTKQSVGNVFAPAKKSEFDISKLAEGTGSVAAKYESGSRGAGTVSTGIGDAGGKSYGTHQLSSKTGTLNAYLKQSEYGKQFEGLQQGSPEFDTKWKQLAKDDPNFGKSQKDYIAKTHAAPQMDRLKALGLDTKSKALQEMAFSTGVQYGPNSPIIEQALKASGKDPSKLSAKEVIEIVQDYKAGNVANNFKSSSAGVQQGVAKRHGVNEKADLLKIAEAENNGTLPGANKQDIVATKPNVEKKQGLLSRLFSPSEAAASEIPNSQKGGGQKATAPMSIPQISSGATAQSTDSGMLGGGTEKGNIDAGTGNAIKKGGNVDLTKVNPSFESNFENMASEFKGKTGKPIQVNSGYRDSQKQARLYAENMSQYPPNGNGKVARPGKSPHEKGLAIDINSGNANTADKLGLLDKWSISRPLLNHPRIPEAWHLQPAGVATASFPTLQSTGGIQSNIGSAVGGGGTGGGASDINREQEVYAPPKSDIKPIATKKESSPLMAVNESSGPNTNTNTASVKPKQTNEGSIANIKNNSTQGSEGTMLKNREVATDASNNAANAQGTQQAINNINVGGSSSPPSLPTPTIFTGDQISYATRLAKSY